MKKVHRFAIINTRLGLGLAAIGLAVLASGCARTGKERPAILADREIIPAPYAAPAETAPAVAATDTTNRTWRESISDTFRSKPAQTVPAPMVAPAPAVAPAPVATPLPSLVLDTPASKPPATTPAPTLVSPNYVQIKEPAAAPTTLALPDVPKVQTLSYTVKKGDTLWDIGRMYGVHFNELAAFNNMKAEDKLLPGKVLRIPPGGRFIPENERPAVRSTPLVKATPAPAAGGRYTVQKGDSLWLIARRHGMTVADLKSMNSLTSDVIVPGQVLAVTGTVRTTPTAAAVTPTTATTTPARPAPQLVAMTTDAAPTAGKYTVKPGDSIWLISRNTGVPMDTLLSLNNLGKNDMIHPGQTLVLTPDGRPATTAATTTPTAVALTPAATPTPTAAAPAATGGADLEAIRKLDWLPHYVEKTDTLSSIAEMYDSRPEWIRAVNPGVASDKDLANVEELKVPVKRQQ